MARIEDIAGLCLDYVGEAHRVRLSKLFLHELMGQLQNMSLRQARVLSGALGVRYALAFTFFFFVLVVA